MSKERNGWERKKRGMGGQMEGWSEQASEGESERETREEETQKRISS